MIRTFHFQPAQQPAEFSPALPSHTPLLPAFLRSWLSGQAVLPSDSSKVQL